MRLFWEEMKKIWRPGILAAIVLIGAMFYWVRPEFYMEYFNRSNGSAAAYYELALGWLEKYGVTMEPEERAELDGQLAEEQAVFAGQLAAIPEAAAEGITDWDSFIAFQDDYWESWRQESEDYFDSEEHKAKERLLRRIQGGTNYETVKTLTEYMDSYDNWGTFPWTETANFREATPLEQARMREIWAKSPSILPAAALHSTWCYGKYLAIWTVLSVLLLLSPVLVRDRLRRIRSLQWSSRRGRRVLRTQMAAAGASAAMLTVLNIVLYGIPFLANSPMVFKDCPLKNCYGVSALPWFDWTYGQYILALMGMVLLIGLGAGAAAVFFSQYSGNYVAMLLKGVPLFLVAGAGIASWLMEDPFAMRTVYPFSQWLYPNGWEIHLFPCVELAGALALLGGGSGLCVWSCRRQERRELAGEQ